MENDLTNEILAELDVALGIVRSGYYGHPRQEAGVKFKQGCFSRLAMFWLYGDTGYLLSVNAEDLLVYRQGVNDIQQTLLALANICVEIDLHEGTTGAGIKKVLAERQRQISRNRTIARDKYLYKGDELKQFAMHRLTGELRYYPLENPAWSNVVKKHPFLTNQVQAGALLLAHLQKEEGQRQFDELQNKVQKGEVEV